MTGEAHPSGTALVTGGARRAGKVFSLALARAGFNIALHARADSPEARQTRAEILETGRRCELFFCDLVDREALSRLVREATEVFKDLKILVNSAAVFERADEGTGGGKLLEKHFAVNFQAPVELTRRFAESVRKGCVINILDSMILGSNKPYEAYLMSKKALAKFTLEAAREYGPQIRVNGVAPGPFIMRGPQDEAYFRKTAAKLPSGRNVTAQEVAVAVVVLAKDETATGKIVFVDGAKHPEGTGKHKF